MPYARPTLTQLRDAALQDINAAVITGANGVAVTGVLPVAVLRIMAYVMAGFAFLHYQFLDWIAKQAVPFTATDEFLAGWGALKGKSQLDATPAAGNAQFSGLAGADIPLGSPVTRGDGFTYATTADAEVASTGIATVPISATTPGSLGNCDQGTPLLLGGGVANVQASGTASTPIVGGTDQESQDAYRTRVLAAYAAPAQGGDMADYIEWAMDVPGVSRAWVAPGLAGSGSVTVFVMFDAAEAANGGFPVGSNGTAAAETRGTAVATGDQLDVANAIYPERPATALVYVCAPTPAPQNFAIANLGSANTATMQAAITAALTDMFLRLANVGGAVNPATGQPYPALDPNAWYAALNAIPGLTSFTVTAPTLPLTPATGALLTLGTVTYSS